MTIVSSSTGAFFERARQDMTALRSQTEQVQTQIGSGQRLDRSSDDPVAASRLRMLARSDKLAKIDSTSANRASADLTLADAALSDIADAIGRAKVLAQEAANGTMNDQQRASIGKELEALHGSILLLANSEDSTGHALFGGQSASQAYTLDAAGNAVYVGSGTSGDLPLGEGQSVTRSLTGPEFLNFTTASGSGDLMGTIKTLADALQGGSPDPAGTARTSLDALSAGLDAVTTGQTIIGARLAWIDVAGQQRTSRDELRAGEEMDVGGTDTASSIAKLQEMMVVLQASQASFAKVAGLSLFNQLN